MIVPMFSEHHCVMCVCVCDCVCVCVCCMQLYLRGNEMGDKGVEAICDALQVRLTHTHTHTDTECAGAFQPSSHGPS